MKSEKLLLELETLCEQAGYQIRKERGTFKGDHCIIEGDQLVVINKNRPIEVQLGVYAKILRNVDTEQLYIKPAIRKQLNDMWERVESLQNSEFEEPEE